MGCPSVGGWGGICGLDRWVNGGLGMGISDPWQALCD